MNLLEPGAPIKQTSNHLIIIKLLVLCGAGGIGEWYFKSRQDTLKTCGLIICERLSSRSD